MLSEISQDGTVVWYCQSREFQDDPPCGIKNTAMIDSLEYREAPDVERPGKGAVIRLPACPCGASADLKADYTVKELTKALIRYEENGTCAVVLPLRYVHNLHVHFLLYQRGKAAYAPVLDMPPQAVLEHPSFAAIQPSTVYALWFGFSIAKQAQHTIEPSTVYLLETTE